MFLFSNLPDFIINIDQHNASYWNQCRDTKLFISYSWITSERNNLMLPILTTKPFFSGREIHLVDNYFNEEKYIRFDSPRVLDLHVVLTYFCEFQKEVRSLIKHKNAVYNMNKVKPVTILNSNELIINDWLDGDMLV